jgi:hypothetical protein
VIPTRTTKRDHDLGPLLVAAAGAAQVFLKLQGLNPSLLGVPRSVDIHKRTWLQTMFADWNLMVANFEILSQELRQHNEGSRDYNFTVNKTISKLQGALQETGTKIQLVVVALRYLQSPEPPNIVTIYIMILTISQHLAYH